MQNTTYELNSDYIELHKLLKITRLAHSGGVAKILIEEGEVRVNDEIEQRKRAKIKKGDRIVFQDQQITVV